MKIRIGFDLAFQIFQTTPMVLTLNVHPSREHDLVVPDALTVEPVQPIRTYLDSFGNRCTRVVAQPGEIRFTTDALIEDSGLPDEVNWNALQTPIEALPDECFAFLLASRYCEVDQLCATAWNLFGNTTPGWPRVQAIVNYVHNHIRFDYQRARCTKSALDAHNEREGVCRDFAHLAITFCRAMNIPARYATGYLGDIGVPKDPAPMDFSAWFEVFLDGRWYTFDARHNRPRVGRVVMARGRDAADVALTTSFGATNLTRFTVWTDEVIGEAEQALPLSFAAE